MNLQWLNQKAQGNAHWKLDVNSPFMGPALKFKPNSSSWWFVKPSGVWGRPPLHMLILGVAPIEKITPGWWLKINPHLWNGKNIVRLVWIEIQEGGTIHEDVRSSNSSHFTVLYGWQWVVPFDSHHGAPLESTPLQRGKYSLWLLTNLVGK